MSTFCARPRSKPVQNVTSSPHYTSLHLAISRPYAASQYFIYNHNPSSIPSSWNVQSLQFTVSQLSAPPSNVDLFIQTDPSKVDSSCPGYTNFDKQSTNGPPLPQVISYSLPKSPITYYIAVSAFTSNNNQFSISVMGVGPGIAQPLTSTDSIVGYASLTQSTLYSYTFLLTVSDRLPPWASPNKSNASYAS